MFFPNLSNRKQKTAFQYMWENHPGKEEFYPGGGDHQCSINMSAALQFNNVDMSRYTGTYFPYKFAGRNFKLARDVNELSYWVLNNINHIVYPEQFLGRKTYPNPNWTHKRLYETYSYTLPDGTKHKPSTDVYFYDAESGIKGKTGIVIMWECWLLREKGKEPTMKSPIRGHIDLWNKTYFKRAGRYGEENSDYNLIYQSSKVDFIWIL